MEKSDNKGCRHYIVQWVSKFKRTFQYRLLHNFPAFSSASFPLFFIFQGAMRGLKIRKWKFLFESRGNFSIFYSNLIGGSMKLCSCWNREQSRINGAAHGIIDYLAVFEVYLDLSEWRHIESSHISRALTEFENERK